MLLRFSLIIFLLTVSCSRPQVPSQQVATNATPSPTAAPTPSPKSASAIHQVDFENFTYPAFPIYSKGERPFTLKNGGYPGRLQDGGVEPEPVSLVDIVYGDVTGDGIDDAIAVLTVSIRGTAIPYYVYIYGIEHSKPKQLWAFDTGDRAEGGLRRVAADNGKLLVELYGKEMYVGADYYASVGACCPAHYTRSRYEWKQSRFVRVSQLETFPTDGGAPYLFHENP